MSYNPVVLFDTKYALTADTLQYTSSGGKTRIDKMTVTNIGTSPVSITVGVVAAAATALDGSNQSIATKFIQAGETYLCPELVGKLIGVGGGLRTACSVTAALDIGANGTLIT